MLHANVCSSKLCLMKADAKGFCSQLEAVDRNKILIGPGGGLGVTSECKGLCCMQ